MVDALTGETIRSVRGYSDGGKGRYSLLVWLRWRCTDHDRWIRRRWRLSLLLHISCVHQRHDVDVEVVVLFVRFHFTPRGVSKIQFVPIASNLEQYFRVDATTLGSLFHRQTGSFQHSIALLLALQNRALDFVRI